MQKPCKIRSWLSNSVIQKYMVIINDSIAKNSTYFTLFDSNHILIAFEEFGFLKFNAKIANKTLKLHTSMQRY